ncbi:peptidase B [Rodentibacter pneumotropicus]|uniref:Peptidase B n=1 Tax=Rodentibacter pneumotropicus TaxID=758 RepID=A0A3S4U5Q1_9PAST|nr:peptidase B [Rodentibacter pneumotropicus]
MQRAARKLRGQGIKDVELVGEEWNLDFCWAFYQGFYTAKQDYSIEFPHLEHDLQDELLARIECSDFVRDVINEPAQSLTPIKLAERAAEFITVQAEIIRRKVQSVFKLFPGKSWKRKVIKGFGT